MGAHGGPNMTEDGVVFYYDTGNSKSYAGEPTTNILNNNIRGEGGATLGTDSFGDFIQLADATTGYSRFQLPSIPVSSNDIYTWSFELYSTETITTGYSWDTNEYSDQFPNSNDLSRVTFTASTPSTIPAGVWTPFSLTVTMKDGLTGAYTYDFFNFFYPAMQNKKFYYRNMQFEFKDHKTQYAGQGGTRSVTEGLLDFTDNSTIDLSNVSFTAEAQPRWDGADDYISLADGTKWFTNEWAYELVVKFTGNSSNWQGLVWGEGATQSGYSGYQKLFLYRNTEFQHRVYNTISGWGSIVYAPTNFDPTQYNHLVWQWNNGTTNIAINGEIVHTHTGRGSYSGGTDSPLFIGARNDLAYDLNGEIPYFKRYSRTLTAEEVAENFNGIRSRFGI